MNDRYHHGIGSRLELTDAELALTKARLSNMQLVHNETDTILKKLKNLK